MLGSLALKYLTVTCLTMLSLPLSKESTRPMDQGPLMAPVDFLK